MNIKIKKIWNIVNSILIGLIAIIAFAIAGIRLFGLNIYVVLSSSMEPAYMTGSVIYVKEADIDQLKVGDAITFCISGETIATHRIIGITAINGEKAFRTKGDANEVEDAAAVPASQVVGKPIFTIPYLGYLVIYIQGASGHYATIAVCAVLLLSLILPDIIWPEDKNKKDSLSNACSN